jgi:ABC-2 type transport system ATP-binding protein
MISAENIYMHYPVPKKYIEYITKPLKQDRFTALHELNLKIEVGDRVAFLGTNGAGKTTFLKIIGGLLYPTSGKLTVNGYDTTKDNLKARKRVGFVLNEERSFYWRLSGKQNLLFFGTLDNMYGDELENKVNELIQLVGLEDAQHKLFAGYSSGMKQRLAIARGLLSDPDILILDEPTRTLDPISVEDISLIISDRIHSKKGRTLLIATHSLAEAQSLCNKACIMKKGRILVYAEIENFLVEYGSLEICYKTLICLEFGERNKNNESFAENSEHKRPLEMSARS